MKRKYALGGFKLPINVVYDTVNGGPARVQDSGGRTIKVFRSHFAEARKLANKLNNQE